MKIGIIGFGYLGQTLAKAHYNLQNLEYVVIRNQSKRNEAKHQFENVNIYKSILDLEKFADINLILVQDSEISNLIGEILNSNIDINNKIFIHCSGILELEILGNLENNGAVIGAAHPYQTFWNKSIDNLKNISWLVDTVNGFDQIKGWINSIGGNVIEKKSIDKRGYHLSAVLASNYMNLLFYISKNVSIQSGFNPREFIPEIAKTTLDNNLKNLDDMNTFPLTGPVARGDRETLIKHLDFLDNEKELKNAYIYLSLATIQIAMKNNLISDDKSEQLIEILEKNLVK